MSAVYIEYIQFCISWMCLIPKPSEDFRKCCPAFTNKKQLLILLFWL